MAVNWGNVFYGAERGVDAFAQGQRRERALTAAGGLFEQLGSEEATGYAELLRSDPDAAAIFAKEFGGLNGLYSAMRENALYTSARRAQRVERAAMGQALGGDYEEFGAYGGDPAKLATARKAAREAEDTPLTEFAKRLKAYDVDPEDWTGESLDAFMADAEAEGAPDYGLLVPRVKPSSKSAGTAPKPGAIPGYQAVKTGVDENGQPTYRYVPVPGAPRDAGKELSKEKLKVMAEADAHPEWLDDTNPAFNTPQAKLFRVRYFRALGIKSIRDQAATLNSFSGLTEK